jgi:hypothetical protein
MYYGRIGYLRYSLRERPAEKFTLAVDYLGVPLYYLFHESVSVRRRERHAHVGINGERDGFDIIHVALFAAVRIFRKSEYSDVMSLFDKLLGKISYGGNDAVGFRSVKVGSNKYSHYLSPLLNLYVKLNFFMILRFYTFSIPHKRKKFIRFREI